MPTLVPLTTKAGAFRIILDADEVTVDLLGELQHHARGTSNPEAALAAVLPILTDVGVHVVDILDVHPSVPLDIRAAFHEAARKCKTADEAAERISAISELADEDALIAVLTSESGAWIRDYVRSVFDDLDERAEAAIQELPVSGAVRYLLVGR